MCGLPEPVGVLVPCLAEVSFLRVLRDPFDLSVDQDSADVGSRLLRNRCRNLDDGSRLEIWQVS